MVKLIHSITFLPPWSWLAVTAEMVCNSQLPQDQIYFFHNITFSQRDSQNVCRNSTAAFNLHRVLIGHTGGMIISGQNHPVDVLKHSIESIKYSKVLGSSSSGVYVRLLCVDGNSALSVLQINFCVMTHLSFSSLVGIPFCLSILKVLKCIAPFCSVF